MTDCAEKIIELNEMLRKYAKDNKIIYVDYHTVIKNGQNGLSENLAKDGVHPTREGYDIMKGVLLKALK